MTGPYEYFSRANLVTSNTVNMPMLKQFDMSKVSGMLCGANINCSTINFNSST
jgi:hypothetical protein